MSRTIFTIQEPRTDTPSAFGPIRAVPGPPHGDGQEPDRKAHADGRAPRTGRAGDQVADQHDGRKPDHDGDSQTRRTRRIGSTRPVGRSCRRGPQAGRSCDLRSWCRHPGAEARPQHADPQQQGTDAARRQRVAQRDEGHQDHREGDQRRPAVSSSTARRCEWPISSRRWCRCCLSGANGERPARVRRTTARPGRSAAPPARERQQERQQRREQRGPPPSAFGSTLPVRVMTTGGQQQADEHRARVAHEEPRREKLCGRKPDADADQERRRHQRRAGRPLHAVLHAEKVGEDEERGGGDGRDRRRPARRGRR